MRILFLLAFSIPLISFSQNRLSIEVLGVPNSDGNIMVALYNTSDSFLKSDRVYKADSVHAKEGITEVEISDIPDGEYAVAIFHDANGNDELDTNWLGIPKEDVGFSRAKMKTFGPPKFSECSFKMESDKDKSVRVEL